MRFATALSHSAYIYTPRACSLQVYDVLKHVAGMSNEELGATFEDWNTGELQVWGRQVLQKSSSGNL